MNNFERRTIAEQSSQSVNQTNQAENPQKGRHGLGNKDEAPREEEEERQKIKRCCNPFLEFAGNPPSAPNDVLWSPFFLLVFPSLREK